MNEQQLQQILTIQQAITAAATAAIINGLLNPQQQQQGLANANALTESSNDLQLHQHQSESQRQSPAVGLSTNTPPNMQSTECNTQRIQDILLQLQQQASAAGVNNAVGLTSTASALNLNLNTQPLMGLASGSPIRSPVNRLAAQDSTTATTSNTQHQSNHHQVSPIKKLKTRHHQQPFHNRSSEATSKPQHSNPKTTHSTTSGLSGRSANNSSTSSSSPFMTNNVGLPRKLVRGQDVWLGRGAEQTRQILKCMWCGQSFRTLAEMSQHMKVTQHYTNIISQEQITSWRQPENTEASSKHGKQSAAQLRSFEDNQDDSSDKFNDSDKESSFSNDEEPELKHKTSQNRTDYSKNNLNLKNDQISDSNDDDPSKAAHRDSPSLKPLTRSRKREHETSSSPIRDEGGENLSATSSSSQQRPNSSVINLNLDSTNEESEVNSKQETKLITSKNDAKELSSSESTLGLEGSEEVEEENKSTNDSVGEEASEKDDDSKANGNLAAGNERSKEETMTNEEGDPAAGAEDEDNGDNYDEQASETNESTATTTTSDVKSSAGQKVESGDPLLALETMVEKSFDPRLRPGVANGGILQRLGIDEEVCPPWQHINYANWYAAAAYGHPMAAALLAAGINLQNGIKLSKNVGSKKNED